MQIFRLCTLLLFGAICVSAAAAELSLVSTEKQTGLLELYSSEGCSSCPPADKWLSTFKDKPQLWQDVIPVAFHVDYWDDIGWKDRFASREYTRRQHRYNREKSTKAVYTPGFLYNGREWRQWFESRQLNFPAAKNTGVLQADISEGDIQISFIPTEKIEGPVVINVALLGFDLATPVKAGENRGRELHHDFVVLALEQTELSGANNIYTGSTKVPESNINAPRLGIAIWVSGANRQRPLQAVGGWLSSEL
ncbi:MAG: DUF1223 domain-containing protein [Pseudomonadales bacterium]